MNAQRLAALAHHTSLDAPVPTAVRRLAGGRPVAVVWKNERGGRTYVVGDHHVKWEPHGGADLDGERVRLAWLRAHHPVPGVVDHGADADGQWLATTSLPGRCGVDPVWWSHPHDVATAMADGLRRLHAVPLEHVPNDWRPPEWLADDGARPSVVDPVLLHGDACVPNTVLGDDGAFVGHVDVGDLCVGDPWADLALACASLRWFAVDGLEKVFLAAYGTTRDPARQHWYASAWRDRDVAGVTRTPGGTAPTPRPASPSGRHPTHTR